MSRIGVGGLLNMEKIQLVGMILENLETFHRHYRAERQNAQKRNLESKASVAIGATDGQVAEEVSGDAADMSKIKKEAAAPRQQSVGPESRCSGGSYEPIQQVIDRSTD